MTDLHKDPVIELLDEPKLYVGTYAKYNSGSIQGAWLTISDYQDIDSFVAAARELHKDESDPELMYQDFECFPEELYNESGLDERIFAYGQMDAHDRELVSEYANAVGSLPDELEQAVDAFYTELDEFNRERQFGEHLADEGLLGIEVPEQLASYIDFEAIGRDYLMDYSVSDNGFVFQNN